MGSWLTPAIELSLSSVQCPPCDSQQHSMTQRVLEFERTFVSLNQHAACSMVSTA